MANLDQDISRGNRAKLILEDELFKTCVEQIEAEFWRLFKETSPVDQEKLQFIKQMQYIHGKYLAFFTQTITNGKIAEMNVESKKKTLRDKFFAKA